MDLNDPLLIVAIAAVVVVIALIVLFVSRSRRQRRTRHLRERFGPEYTRTVDRRGSRAKAEAELEDREQRHDGLRLVDLDAEQRRSFHLRWDELQTSFVDGPESAVRGAEILVDDAARARGYPDADAEQRLLDLGVDHSDEVHRYREASDDVRGKTGTDVEARRRQLLAARGVFEALVGPAPSDAALAHEAPRRDEPVVEAPFDRIDEPAAADDGVARATDRSPREATVADEPTRDGAWASEPSAHDAPRRDEPAVEAPFERVLDGAPEPGLGDQPPRSDEHPVTPPPPPPPENPDGLGRR